MVLSGFSISIWWLNYHARENYCKAISPALTIILAWECSWFDLAILTYGEAMKPTFGKKAYRGDTPMPADDYCLYHCINHVLSNGSAKPTTTAAMRFRAKVVARLRAAGLPEQAKQYYSQAPQAILTSRTAQL